MDNDRIKSVKVSAYKIPTDEPESDGTLEWDHTTMILVRILAGNNEGVGYTYASYATAIFIENELKPIIEGKAIGEIPALFSSMVSALRNNGTCGITMMAVSALDIALWDLKAKLLDIPLYQLLGKYREGMPVYGSGGFTSYNIEELQNHMHGWAEEGMPSVKMKIGRHPKEDLNRIQAVMDVLPKTTELYIDANAAYQVKQAIDLADQLKDSTVTWFEEPVNSFHTDQLAFIKDHIPPFMRLACGEYGYHPAFYKSLMINNIPDIIQADITRCGGITGFLQIGAFCAIMNMPLSSHCAPLLHVQPAMALAAFYTGEYFYDHVNIEKLLFRTEAYVKDGVYYPSDAPGLGIHFNDKDAQKFKI